MQSSLLLVKRVQHHQLVTPPLGAVPLSFQPCHGVILTYLQYSKDYRNIVSPQMRNATPVQ